MNAPPNTPTTTHSRHDSGIASDTQAANNTTAAIANLQHPSQTTPHNIPTNGTSHTDSETTRSGNVTTGLHLHPPTTPLEARVLFDKQVRRKHAKSTPSST
jgi:hypothetical protein